MLVAAAAVVLAVVLVARGCGDDKGAPPVSRAAHLVPANALIYLHLSTDQSRPAVRDALATAKKFPSFARIDSAILGPLRRIGGGVSFERDVRPWLGKEASLALLDTATGTAGSLILLDVADHAKAQKFLDRAAGSAAAGTTVSGVKVQSFGGADVAFLGSTMVIGQTDSVQAAIRASKGSSLATLPAYRRATSDLAGGRVADAYVSPDGVTRLLTPQGGALGAAGALIDQPGLSGTALSLSPRGGDIALRIHSVVDVAAAKRAGRPRPTQFEPQLVDRVPRDALAYLGLTHLDRAGGRLLTAGLAGGGAGRTLTTVLQRAGKDLAGRGGLALAPLLQGEAAVWLIAAVPAPVLGITLQSQDAAATTAALNTLQPSFAKLLAPAGGAVPKWRTERIAGIDAQRLDIGRGAALLYAVFDGTVVVSTDPAGIVAARRRPGLGQAARFRAALRKRPSRVSSLVFLDFTQLLGLGERTGLSGSKAYLAVREDLRKVIALGAVATGGTSDSTTELMLDLS